MKQKEESFFTVTGTEETYSEKKRRDEEALRDLFPGDTSLASVSQEMSEKDVDIFKKIKNYITALFSSQKTEIKQKD